MDILSTIKHFFLEFITFKYRKSYLWIINLRNLLMSHILTMKDSGTIGEKLPLDAINPAHRSLLRLNSPSHGIFSLFLNNGLFPTVITFINCGSNLWQQEAIVNETDVGPALESYCNVRLGRGMHVLDVESNCLLSFKLHPMSCTAVTFMAQQINSLKPNDNSSLKPMVNSCSNRIQLVIVCKSFMKECE